MRLFRWPLLILMIVSVFALTGCNLFSSESLPSDEPPDSNDSPEPVEYLLIDDFSEETVGSKPSGWTVTNSNGTDGLIEVIEAPELESGKAVRAVAYQYETGSSKNVGLSKSDNKFVVDDEVTVVAIQYKVRWISGSGVYSNLVQQGGTPSNNRFIWSVQAPNEFKYISPPAPPAVPLNEGWNDIRIVADRTTDKVDVYINDMDTPALESMSINVPMETWNNAYLAFSHWTSDKQEREVHYADFKVWIVK